jgi:hypothetical protein
MPRLHLCAHAIALKRGRLRGSIEVGFPGRTGLGKVRTRPVVTTSADDTAREFLAGG